MRPLKFTESKQINGREIRSITISLSDPCKNGFCEFRIDTTTKMLVFGDWQEVYKGEKQRRAERATFRDYFKMFESVDGCTSWGAEWYAVENGRYILETEGPEKCANYLHIPVEVASQLDATSNDYFKYQLFALGLVDKWEKDAKEAISKLEALCGYSFEDYDQPRKNLVLTDEERAEVEKKLEEGFYTPEAVARRKEEKERAEREQKRAELVRRYDDEIAKCKLQRAIMILVFDTFGTADNVIYYDHSRVISFNWNEPQWATYSKHWTEKEVTRFERILKDDPVLGPQCLVELKHKYE